MGPDKLVTLCRSHADFVDGRQVSLSPELCDGIRSELTGRLLGISPLTKLIWASLIIDVEP
jgi:hypothetical protein